ncbi:hypothetical protein NM688_g1234 [Phlebia brevispora]|uniref:Uncharacterized protein n=1 Tax=Phlebia brevispora TaxID=194682 RepID=A0ACC1TBY1_9APHY|nr:hypothetical protein NM688_g1234 [Phlebia brevispora]
MWWNADCTRAHDTLHTAQRAIPQSHPQRQEELGILKNTLREVIKKAKCEYYERVIAETHSQRIWDLVEWTHPCKDQNYHMLTCPDGSAILDNAEMTEAFCQQFFTEKPRDINLKWVDDLSQQLKRSFPLIIEKEMIEQITKTSNHTAAVSDYITWHTWKHVAKTNPHALVKLKIFFNAMVHTDCHLSQFKRGLSLCLAKPGRDHMKAKGYRLIILLNTLSKWFEKIIARCLQFDGQKSEILHLSQFGGTIQHSTTDAGVQLIHNICRALFRVAPIDQILPANIQLQMFVDNGFFYAINCNLEVNCHFIACFYKNLVIHLWNFGIDIGADKNKLIHFQCRWTPWAAELPLELTVTLYDLQLQQSHIQVVPQPKVHYLRFYLDQSLTFKDHIKYFANKVMRTIDVLRSLGNSVKGLTPVDKQRLYLSNVIPLMTYRATLCPIHAVEMIAGLILVHYNVNKLMKHASLWTRTLPYSHPLRAHLPQLWNMNKLNITVTPIKYIDKYSRTSTEDFLPLHAENCPSDHFLENVDLMHLVFDVKPSCKKGTDKFDEWLRDTLMPTLQDALKDPTALNIFTDGSIKKKTERDGTKKCPSYVGIKQNKDVDTGTKNELKLLQPDLVSYSIARERATIAMLANCTIRRFIILPSSMSPSSTLVMLLLALSVSAFTSMEILNVLVEPFLHANPLAFTFELSELDAATIENSNASLQHVYLRQHFGPLMDQIDEVDDREVDENFEIFLCDHAPHGIHAGPAALIYMWLIPYNCIAESILRMIACNAHVHSRFPSLAVHLSSVASPLLPDLPLELPPPSPEPPPVNEREYWIFDGFSPTPKVTPPPEPLRLHLFEDGSGYVYGGPLPSPEGTPVSYDGDPLNIGVIDHIPTVATELHFTADLVEQLQLLMLDAPRPLLLPRPLPNWDLDDFDEWDPRDLDFPSTSRAVALLLPFAPGNTYYCLSGWLSRTGTGSDFHTNGVYCCYKFSNWSLWRSSHRSYLWCFFSHTPCIPTIIHVDRGLAPAVPPAHRIRNYIEWAIRVEAELIRKKLWYNVVYIEGEPAEGLTIEERDTWWKAKLAKRSKEKMSRDPMESLGGFEEGSRCSGLGHHSWRLRRHWWRMVKGEKESMSAWIGRVKGAVHQLVEIGVQVSDEDRILVLTNGLSSSYDSFVISLDATPVHELTLEVVINRLLNEEVRRENRSEQDVEDRARLETAVMLARGSSGSGIAVKAGARTCWSCGEVGHGQGEMSSPG